MYVVRCSLGTSHSNISKFEGAVAAVSWVSVLRMWLWYVFWACQNRRKRFGITHVQRKRFRKVDKISAAAGPGAPERVGRGTVFQYSVTVIS